MPTDPSATVSDLHAHAVWLRRLAVRLLGPGADAEDAFQDTWAAALAHPPRDPVALPRWLSQVLRNFVRMRLRGERNRARRETAGEHIERDAPLSPEELLARHEALALLAEQVRRLDEPYRTTILLRYAEDLSPAEIARLQGVPAGTIRWRLKRGLDQLRERILTPERRDRWALVATQTSVGAAAAAAPGSLIIGVPLLLAKWKAAVGTVAVALLLAALSWWRLSDSPMQHPPSQPSGPTPAGPAALRLRTDESGVSPRRGSVTGVVRDLGGQGVAGATVAAFLASPPPGGDAAHAPAAALAGMALTNPDGSYRLAALPAGRYRVSAAALGFVPASAEQSLAAAEEVAGVDLTLGRGGHTLTGRVFDTGGGTIARAAGSIWLDSRWPAAGSPHVVVAVRAGDDGTFRVTLPAGQHAYAVAADGYAPELGALTLVGDMSREFRLNPASSLAGRVIRRGAGTPVPGALVRAESAGFTAEATSDSTGAFALFDLDPGTYTLHARAGAFAGRIVAPVPLPFATARMDVVLELDAGRVVSGRIVRAGGGQPVPDALVELLQQTAPGVAASPRALGTAGGDGRFRLAGVLPGSYQLRAEHEGLGEARRPVVVDATTDVEGVELSLDARATLYGIVVDAREQPVPGALVTAYTDNEGRERPSGPVRTDAGGRFRLGDVRAGRFVVEVSDRERGVTVQKGTGLAPGESRSLTLRFAGRARVNGQVLWEDGTPARGLMVMGGSWRGRAGGSSTTTGEDGRYSVGPYVPGSVALIFLEPAPGWRGGAQATDGGRLVRIEGDADVDGIDFRLPRADGQIVGVVVGPDGLPLAGAVVSSHPGRAGARVVSGDDGGFAIGDLVPGRYALRAEYAGWPPAELADVEAGARPVQIRLRAAARLEGLVVDSRGRPTTGTTVWARPPSPAGARESVPAPVASTWVDNPEGRFILNGLSPGSYDLIALTAAGQSGSLPRLTVEAGATRSGLRIVLGAGVTVTGKAIDLETRAPMTGVSVRAEGDGRLWQTRTDSSGGFRVAGLPRGLELQLSLEQAGYLAHGRRLVPPLEGDSLELRSLPLLAERPSAGHTGRLGVVIEPREDGQTLIRRAAADMPAYRAGVRDGDMLVTVDNREVTNASASTVVKLLGGPPRTKVVLGIRRGGDALRSIAVERL